MLNDISQMSSQPSKQKSQWRQLGTAAIALFPTVLIIAFLVFAIPFHNLPTLEDLLPPPENTTSAPVPPKTSSRDVRYFINFGDSWSRTGFNSSKTGPRSEANPSARNPIGNPEWPGDTSSGGKNWIGYMTSEFNSTLTLAWNFASSGAVIDRYIVRPRLEGYPSFAQQVEQFNASIAHRPDYAPWTADNTVAGIWFGINDLGRSYAFSNLTLVVPQLVESLVSQTQVIYNFGIRKFLFLEFAPVDLLPNILMSRNTDPVRIRYFVSTYNLLLRQQLGEFRDANPDVNATLVTISDIFWAALMDPQSLGAPNATCLDRKGTSCLWRDGAHPAQKIHRLIGERAAKEAWG